MRRYFGPRTLLLGSVFIVILAQLISAVRDPDFWWHIRTGQWILDHGRLPGHDLFTFTVPPSRVWTDHEYLSEVLMWLIYSHFGVAAFSLAIGLMTWLSFWLIYQRAGGGTQPYVVVGIAIALGVMAGAPIFGPRAQMVTFFFTCLELLWIERFLARGSRPESTRRRFPAMYLFPLLMVLWVNMHGSWIFGLGLLGIVLASEALLWLVNRDDRHKENCQRLGAVLVLSCLTPLLTPNGPALLAYPLVTQGSQAQQSLIVEWLSPDFHSASIHPFEAMLLLLFVGMILQRPRLRDLLLSLAVVVLSLQSVRHMVLFVAVATPILIEVWAGVWRQQVNLHPRLGTLGAAEPRLIFAVTTIVCLVAVMIATTAIVARDLGEQASADAASYPVGAVAYLNAHPDLGHRMYNQYGWGGYLAFRLYPEPNRRVFIFGEAVLMGDPLLEQYERVQTLDPTSLAILDRCGVDYVVYNQKTPLTLILSAPGSGWTRVYSDKLAVIFVRDDPLPISNPPPCG